MATTAPFDIGTLITSTPGVYGGRPCLAGTRFPVLQIAAYVRNGWSPEDIMAEHPRLDEAKVYAGIAYYVANRADFHAELDVDTEVIREAYLAEAERRAPRG